MARPSFQLRIKTADLQTVIRDQLTSSSSVADLVALIPLKDDRTAVGKLLTGFPPKAIAVDLSDILSLESTKLAEVGIRSGDTVTVETVDKPMAPPPPPHHNSHHLPTEPLEQEGILLRRVVPADNHCLFTSVHFCMSGDVQPAHARDHREIIAAAVRADKERYSAAILGKTPADYCRWITGNEAWGGAIEVQILAEYFGVEISVIDTKSGSVTHFGEGLSAGQRMLLIYDGIHYDPLTLETFKAPDAPARTLFDAGDVAVIEQAKELAREAKDTRQFTDTVNFQLKCLVCQIKLKGQTEARKHANETGHQSFGEM